MRFQIGAMTIGDLLDRSLKLMMGNLPIFFALNLIVMLPLLVLQLLMPQFLDALTSGQPQLAVVMSGAALGFLVLIVTFLLQPIGTAAILHVIAQNFADQPVTLGQALRFGLSKFGPLLVTSILLGLMLMAGFLMCIVPFFFFALWYYVTSQVVVVENLSGTAAMARSKELTDGFLLRALGLLVLAFFIGAALQAPVVTMQMILPNQEVIPGNQPGAKPIPDPFGLQQGGRVVTLYPNYYINTVFATLVNILAQTFGAILATLFYFDLRIRKEGYDLEMAAGRMTPRPPEPPGFVP